MAVATEMERSANRSLLGLGVAVLVGGLLWFAIDQRETLQDLWRDEPALVVELGGAHHRLSPTEALELDALSREHLQASQSGLQQQLTQLVDEELDRLFADVHARVPAFADWYFSLAGEYSRITFWLLGQAGMVDGDVVLQRLQSELFDDTDYATRLQRLNRAGAMTMQTHHQQMRADWIEQVMQRVSGRTVAPETLPENEIRLSLDDVLPALDQRSGPAFEDRLAASSMAASGAGAATVTARLLGRRALGTAGGSLAARGASRSAARAGPAAGAGAAICSPTVVGAPVCGALAFGLTWVATDWGLLRFDAWRNQAALEAELHNAIAELREDLEAQVLAHWHFVVEQQHADLRQSVERSFIPVRALAAKDRS
ncbi:hypothetical protein M0534_12065 [Methylonatrum kenyense]|uniref:hypothetical protein n=1 Tax=Methylonatrum kenyense TaxID=455253 RepID=UPI0020BDAEAE|nr:hypothetical protein [Methylonatrum kenyense]MCK8517055.1 hypothetical protein [Methylonatrum kenyense]